VVEGAAFTQYNLAVGLVTAAGLGYVLFVRPTVVDYHRFLLVTVAGLLLFLVGGPVTELLAPGFVHWVHGVASLLVILGLFHSTDLVLTPSVLAYNIDYSREEVNRRLVELEERGLVRKPERGKYRITALGRQYIEGGVSRRLLDWSLSLGEREGDA